MIHIKRNKHVLVIVLCIIIMFTSFIRIGGEIKFRYSLDLVLQTCTEVDLKKIKKFCFLKKLNIQQLESEKLNLITNDSLKELVIITSTNNNAYLNLKEFSKLESFYSVGLDFADLSYFASMKKLKNLYLGFGYEKNRIKSSESFESLPVSLEHICFNGLEDTESLDFSNLKNLQTLYVSRSSLSNVYVDNPKLEGISLKNNSSLKNINISENTANLKKIYIIDCPNLMLDIGELKRLSSLQYIYLNNELLTDTDIDALSDCGIVVDNETCRRDNDEKEK